MQGNTELKQGVLHVTMLQCMLQCQDARSLVSSSQNLLPINSSLLPLPPPPPLHPPFGEREKTRNMDDTKTDAHEVYLVLDQGKCTRSSRIGLIFSCLKNPL